MQNNYIWGMITENQDLKSYNTFGIQARAEHFASFHSIDQLAELLDQFKDEKKLILGGGSNVLFTRDFEGVVLRNEIQGFEIVKESEDSVFIKSGAGVVWHDFVMKCVDLGFGGVENLSLIPGSVGASPMQNIGAYGVEIKDVFHELEAFKIDTGELHTFDNKSCEFGYRESVFKRKFKDEYVIVSVTFKLSKNPKINSSYGAIESELSKNGISNPTIKDISNAVIEIRSSKLPDPKLIGNAGSFFKNPVVSEELLAEIQKTYSDVPNYPAQEGKKKLAAGWLIEKAGWKGKTFDTFGVHKLQALVLVNYGGSTGKQIFDLSTLIIEDIRSKFGVVLEREVNII